MADNYLNTLEGLLTLGSGAVAQPVSGIGGLLGLLAGATPEQAANIVAKLQGDLTYQPKTEEGQRFVSDVAGLLEPIGSALESAQTESGDWVYEKTGSPLAAALTQATVGGAPDIVGGLLGAKVLPKGKRYSVGDIGSQTSKVGGKQKGIFAGINAEGAPVEQYMRAQDLLDRGYSPRAVWDETAKTGAPIKVDKAGNLTHEIADYSSSLKQGFNDLVSGEAYGQVRLADVIDHPELFAAYPDVASTRFSLLTNDPSSRGSFNEARNLIEVNPKSGMKTYRSPEEIRSTLLHEIQHKIQSVEELPRGGGPSLGADIAVDADRAYRAGMQKRQSLLDEIANIQDSGQYQQKGQLLNTARTLEELDRLKGYLKSYYAGGKLTDKRRHILNSGGSIMDHNDEFRMRMDINWPKKHRPQAERDAAYAKYIENVIADAQSRIDPVEVEVISGLGVKNPVQKLSRDISKINKQTKPLSDQSYGLLNQSNEAFQFSGGAIPERAIYKENGKYRVIGVVDDDWNPKTFDTEEQAYNAARDLYAGNANYYGLSGEVESRLVQDRLKHDPAILSKMNPFNEPVLREYPFNKQISLGRDYTLGPENTWINLLDGKY